MYKDTAVWCGRLGDTMSNETLRSNWAVAALVLVNLACTACSDDGDATGGPNAVDGSVDIGHAWPTGSTNFMTELLLQYPKGMPKPLMFPGTIEEYIAEEPDQECAPERTPAYLHVPGCPVSCSTDPYNG